MPELLTRDEVELIYQREAVGDVRRLATAYLALLDHVANVDPDKHYEVEVAALQARIDELEIVVANRAEHVPEEQDALAAELAHAKNVAAGKKAAQTKAAKARTGLKPPKK